MTKKQIPALLVLTLFFAVIFAALGNYLKEKTQLVVQPEQLGSLDSLEDVKADLLVDRLTDKSEIELTDEMKNEIVEALKKEGVLGLKEELTLEEREVIELQLQRLRQQNPDPRALFKVLEDNYCYEFGVWNDGFGVLYGSDFDGEFEVPGKFRIKADKNGIYAIKARDKYVISTRVTKRIPYLVKGSWECVACWQLIEDSHQTVDVLNAEKCDWHEACGSITSTDGCFTKATYDYDFAVFEKPGLYRLQFFLCPDGIMTKSCEGIMNSTISQT